ncbi:MAG: SDR family NAD(P)-dependent oxidoreductase [Thermodesulfobacteriota bacterium]|jgi:NAD(P)-dependent dehydrogenase (short-subunit alcohol dehydrogenase family)
MRLRGKVALITGGGRGIGRAIALAFAREGADIAVTARTPAEIDQVAAEVRACGRQAYAAPCDVTDGASVTRMAAAVHERFGRVDLLVNNAGTGRSAPFFKTDLSLWNSLFALNATSVYLVTRAVVKGMVERRYGRVINIVSTAGKIPFRYCTAYVASKHAALGFTRALALELAGSGVTVNAICPGWVGSTGLFAETITNIVQTTGRDAAAAVQALADMSPLRRVMEPEEIAHVAVMLAADEAGGITGQGINVCGGTVMD